MTSGLRARAVERRLAREYTQQRESNREFTRRILRSPGRFLRIRSYRTRIHAEEGVKSHVNFRGHTDMYGPLIGMASEAGQERGSDIPPSRPRAQTRWFNSARRARNGSGGAVPAFPGRTHSVASPYLYSPGLPGISIRGRPRSSSSFLTCEGGGDRDLGFRGRRFNGLLTTVFRFWDSVRGILRVNLKH